MTRPSRALRRARAAALGLVSCFALLFSACDETDLVAVRLWVRPDLSGRVATSSVRVPEPGRPPIVASTGVEWRERLDVTSALGEFAELEGLRIEDLVFRAGEAGERLAFLEIELPRGPQARWPRALVPLSADERRAVAGVIDPDGRLDEVGAAVKLEVHLPARVVGHGLSSTPHGAKEKAEAEVATLIVPLERALSADEPLVWHLTWERTP